jgi:hypothetical protein
METRTFIFVGWYLLIGVLCHLFIPKPPKAKEALEMAERIHPAGSAMMLVIVATFWPLVVFGTVRRWIRGRMKKC